MATGETSTENIRTTQRTEEQESETKVEARVGWRYTVEQVRRDTTARIGLYIIGFILFLAAFAWIDAKLFNYAIVSSFWHNPLNDPTSAKILRPPMGTSNVFGKGLAQYPLGTDHRGRDILVRLVYGSRIAMQVGIVSTGFGLICGTLLGAVAGYHGGWTDDILMRFAETLYAIPFLVLVIAFMAAFGRDLTFAMIGVGITTIPVFARLIRSRVVSVREEEYIEAAKAAGVRDRNIILRHVIPNSFAPVLVQATLQVGISILIVAGLSFLGFGAQPPTPSWGQMLSQSRGYMLPDPWFSLWPGLAILVTVMGFNLLGDGLRDALDPRINN